MKDNTEKFKALLDVVKVVPMDKRSHVIQTDLPDGKHWFCGIGFHPGTLNRPDVTPLVVNWTSPYFEDAMRFDKHTADDVNKIILLDSGWQVVEYAKASAYAMQNPYDPTAFKPNVVRLKPAE